MPFIIGSGIIQPLAAAGGGTPGSNNTWNPSDKSPSIDLSNGNLTATYNDVAGNKAVRAVESASAGKFYWELTITNGDSNPQFWGLGFANSSKTLATFLGSTLDGCGFNGAGEFYINDTAVVTGLSTYATGSVLRIAADFDNERVWSSVNGANWNNDGAANPATNTNGIDFSSMNAGPYFAGASMASPTNVVTVNFGASALAYAMPSGFSAWP